MSYNSANMFSGYNKSGLHGARVGNWVEFSLRGGVLRGRDFRGRTFVWQRELPPGEVWWPTVAWAGTRTWRVRIAPAASFAS